MGLNAAFSELKCVYIRKQFDNTKFNPCYFQFVNWLLLWQFLNHLDYTQRQNINM